MKTPRPISISFRRMGMAVALLLAATLSAAPAAGQAATQNVRLRGQVVDVENGQPLPEAYVGFPALGRSVLTDATGTFTITLPPGEHQMVFMRVGYRSAVVPLVMGPEGKEVRLRATPEPVVLEALEATVDAFEERRTRSAMESRAFNAREMEQFGHPSTIDFLTNRAGMRTTPCIDGDYHSPDEACIFVRGETTAVTVILDETLLSGGLGDLRRIPLRDLHRVEVYRGGELIVAYTRTFLLANLGKPRTLHSIQAFRNWARAQGNSIQPQSVGAMDTP